MWDRNFQSTVINWRFFLRLCEKITFTKAIFDGRNWIQAPCCLIVKLENARVKNEISWGGKFNTLRYSLWSLCSCISVITFLCIFVELTFDRHQKDLSLAVIRGHFRESEKEFLQSSLKMPLVLNDHSDRLWKAVV